MYGPNEYSRLWVTPVLPLQKDSDLPDEAGYRTLIERFLKPEYIDAGVAIIANPHAGELPSLTPVERKRLVEVTLDQVAGRVPVFAGIAGLATTDVVAGANDALEAGAEGLFLVQPMGTSDITTSWDPEDIEMLVDAWTPVVKAAGDTPLIGAISTAFVKGYGSGLPTESLLEVLRTFPTIVGWKSTYSYEGYRKVFPALEASGLNVALLAATSKLFHENLASQQFQGSAAGGYNYGHEAIFAHIKAWRSGDAAEAQRIWGGGLRQLNEFISQIPGRLHIRYKLASWLRGFIDTPAMRLPMPRPRQAEADRIFELLKGAGLSTRESAKLPGGTA